MKNTNPRDMLFVHTAGRTTFGISAHVGSFDECVEKLAAQMRGLRPAIHRSKGQRTAVWSRPGVAVMLFQPRANESVCASAIIQSPTPKRRR